MMKNKFALISLGLIPIYLFVFLNARFVGVYTLWFLSFLVLSAITFSIISFRKKENTWLSVLSITLNFGAVIGFTIFILVMVFVFNLVVDSADDLFKAILEIE